MRRALLLQTRFACSHTLPMAAMLQVMLKKLDRPSCCVYRSSDRQASLIREAARVTLDFCCAWQACMHCCAAVLRHGLASWVLGTHAETHQCFLQGSGVAGHCKVRRGDRDAAAAQELCSKGALPATTLVLTQSYLPLEAQLHADATCRDQPDRRLYHCGTEGMRLSHLIVKVQEQPGRSGRLQCPLLSIVSRQKHARGSVPAHAVEASYRKQLPVPASHS